MTIKNILKVAHYYELKYGFNKEAANEFGGRRMSDSPRYTRDYGGERNIRNDSTRAEVGQTAREIVERFRQKALEQAARNARRSKDSEEYIPRKPRNELGDAGEGKEIEFSPSPSTPSPSVSRPYNAREEFKETARRLKSVRTDRPEIGAPLYALMDRFVWSKKDQPSSSTTSNVEPSPDKSEELESRNSYLENEVAKLQQEISKLNEEIASLKNS